MAWREGEGRGKEGQQEKKVENKTSHKQRGDGTSVMVNTTGKERVRENTGRRDGGEEGHQMEGWR